MKQKDEIKIKGSASEVLEELQKLIRDLEEKDCDRFSFKIKFKAWNADEKAARKAAKSRL